MISQITLTGNCTICGKNPELAYRVNSAAVDELVQWCSRAGAHLIYLSTDIVFDGKHAPYEEADQPKPLNIYGKSKYRGEMPLQSITLIV